MKVTKAYNAQSQQVEEAVVTIDINNDYVFTFADKSFFKIPSHLSKEEVFTLIEAEKTANEGQIATAAIEALHTEKLSIFDDATIPEPQPEVSQPQPTNDTEIPVQG